MRLVTHVRGDGDLFDAWVAHYRGLGVTSFHAIVHGRGSENRHLEQAASAGALRIEEVYEGEFLSEEKGRRLNRLLRSFRGEWVVLVDSDEFLELPYDDLSATTRALSRLGATALRAPLLQRLRADGSLESPARIDSPSDEFPLCSPDLYLHMGQPAAATVKYPLLLCGERTRVNSGNHVKPQGLDTMLVGARGVTHHFKWRAPVLERLRRRAQSAHTWRGESAAYLRYLHESGGRLPLEGAFPCSREALFECGLLRRVSLAGSLADLSRCWLRRALPTPFKRWHQRRTLEAIGPGR